jgi:hypothetical protein
MNGDAITYITLALSIITSLVIPFGAFLYRNIAAQQVEIIRQISDARSQSEKHTEHHVASISAQIAALEKVVHRDLSVLDMRVRDVESRQQRHEVMVETAKRDYMPRDEISAQLRELHSENKRIVTSMDSGFKEIMEKIHG